MANPHGYWNRAWQQFRQHRIGYWSLWVALLFVLVGIYAPFLASSKPLVVYFDGEWYFPLFRYLFYRGFFTKRLDLFYNLLMFTLPLFIGTLILGRHYPRYRRVVLLLILLSQLLLFAYVAYRPIKDPASDPALNRKKQELIQSHVKEMQQNPLFYIPFMMSWDQELQLMTPYAKLNLVLRYQQRKAQQQRLAVYQEAYAEAAKKRDQTDTALPTLWQKERNNEEEIVRRQQLILEKNREAYPKAKQQMNWLQKVCHVPSSYSILSRLPPWMVCDFLFKLSQKDRQTFFQAKQVVTAYERAEAEINYIKDRQQWLEEQSNHLQDEIMPLIRPFHWEDDAGGDQNLNRLVSWWDLTRVNRKDMVASLIFGVRISLAVGLLAVALALVIGIPVGAVAGYFGGKTDIIVYRLIEIWESMPTFFMLLMIVAFLQNKSIFLVISVIGFFGWTNFSRFVRGEFFKQKQLPYVEACHALGFNNSYIMFSHLLPNAIPPLLTLVPFAIMGAITSEAALSFLGLGEEGSASWGVLMDEGRTAFPAESYLLWPPAILLTILLVSIALVGDALRDALDPKLHRY